MSLVIIAPGRDMSILCDQLKNKLLGMKVEIWPEVEDFGEVEAAVLWNQPEGVAGLFPNLKFVSSMGAGVDHIIDDPDLPADVPIVRIVDPQLTSMMRKYVVMAITAIHKNLFGIYRQNLEQRWIQDLTIGPDPCIGMMGLGVLGKDSALALQNLGYRVRGWSASRKDIPGVATFTKEEMDDFLSECNILLCMLPLTPLTKGILNARLFEKLPRGSSVINVGRGGHLVEKDLLHAIDKGYVQSAILDVFNEEPLPEDHDFWKYPEVIITPHIASITNQENAAAQIAENYHRSLDGRPLIHLAQRSKGY